MSGFDLTRRETFSDGLARHLEEDRKRQADAQRKRDNPAIDDLVCIVNEIRTFESTLNPDQEVGLILAAVGGTTTLHVERLYRSGPRLLIFEGQNSEGNRVRLVQHHSQVSLTLVAAAKLKDVANRVQIGFDISAGAAI